MEFLTQLGCVQCGVPMEQTGLSCGPCLASPPIHDGVMAAVIYGTAAKSIILKFKYGTKPGLARTIAKYLLRHAARYPDAILVPVPLHRWRIWSRGYNQSAMIAREIAILQKREIIPDLLIRAKKTPVLRGLRRKERETAVRNAFIVNQKHRDDLSGKSIILVDDVYTSGATTNACARALKNAGAAKVHILCWARVLDENTIDH